MFNAQKWLPELSLGFRSVQLLLPLDSEIMMSIVDSDGRVCHVSLLELLYK